ncbi:TolC family outer membrane protein [Thalassococcus sp. S3]|uniref:TolC family outer membrane protein n=1 Tax=Thalassococcus sp. S3 TaxID=2017482 RepID=UPI001024898E|nr:TolC family outer membrane protein [Thalassococcus sp. S3]QBF32881.1 transporter [Thalassococcus sp. S3]
MHFSRLRTGLTSLVFGAAVAVAGAPALLADNLADALVGAYNTSGLLEQNRAVLRAADEDVAIAVSALRPVLSWQAGLERNFGESRIQGRISDNNSTQASLALSLELLLFDSGASRFNIQSTKETVLATRAGLVSIEQAILQRAVDAYMTVIRESEFVALRQNNVRLITQELRAAQDRFEVGEVTRTDVALAESRLAEARSNLATAQGNLVNAQEEYLNAVGRRPGRLSPPPSLPARPASIDAAKAVAVRTHPDIKQAQHQVAAAELLVLQAEASMGPSVSLRGSYALSETFNSSDNSDIGSLSLELSQPIYQGGRLAASLRRAMANRDNTRANLLEIQERVTQEVTGAFVRLDVAQANIQATDRQIRAADVAFRGVREEATLGARTTLDVLDAEQELLDARAARISAQADLYSAAYQLLAAQGLLTAQNLRLAVKIYDPTEYYNLVKDAPAYRSQRGQKLDRVLRALNKD